MKKLTIDYTTSLEFSGPVVDHHFLLRCLPQENHQQQIHSLTLEIEPDAWHAREVDSFFNQIVVGHLIEPHRSFSWTVRAIAFVDHDRQKAMPYKPCLLYTSMGDRVEVLTQNNAKPSRDWLNIVRTPSARAKIRSYFSKIAKADDSVQGREILAREMRKIGPVSYTHLMCIRDRCSTASTRTSATSKTACTAPPCR